MVASTQPRALALFADRIDELAAIDRFLTRLQEGNIHEHAGVLGFYGVGGVGKTTLRQKALAEFRNKTERDMYAVGGLAFAEIDLDSDSVTPASPIADVLGRVRSAVHKAGIRTPLFDYLYLVWWGEENPSQPIDLRRRSDGEGIASGLLDVADLATDLAAVAGGSLLPVTAVAQGLRKLIPRLGDWFEQTRARRRFEGSPEGWSQRERVERMPILLAQDLLAAVRHQPQVAICLVIDGIERVQSRESRPDAQWALAAMVAEVLRCTDDIPAAVGKPLRGRVGFMVFGRERLRWSELYDRERVRTDWKRQLDCANELAGLSEADARWFLIDKTAGWLRENGQVAVAAVVERNVNEILGAASERRPGQPPTYLPYYLDLAVLVIRENVASFTPDMLGVTPGELERRFLRSLEPRHLRALQALAIAIAFDRNVFDFLITRGFVGGYAAADFAWLVGNHWSFVNPIDDRSGFYAFHRHMQASLVAGFGLAEEGERAREIVIALIERLQEKMKFERPIDFGVAGRSAYVDVIGLLREHEAAGLLDPQTAVRLALRIDAPFDPSHAMALRRPFLEWTSAVGVRELGAESLLTLGASSKLAETLFAQGEWTRARELHEKSLEARSRVLGDEHPDTLTSMNRLAVLLRAQGDLANAPVLQQKALEGRRRVLGYAHPETLASMNDLALMLHDCGDLAGARELEENTLMAQRVALGDEHPDTLTSMNNLALTMRDQGNVGDARALQERVLEARTRILGDEHPDTLVSMNNLALTLRDQGDFTRAHDLQEKVLDISLRTLGEEHPDTLVSMNNLALTLRDQGNLARARELQQRTLDIKRRVLGEEHAATLTSMSNLALTLGDQDDLVGARKLQETILAVERRVLGEQHPHRLTSMSNLAGSLFQQGDLPAARDLQEKVLGIRRQALGEEHPDTLTSMGNLAGTLRDQGDLAGARELQEKLLGIRRRVLGEEHPDTVASMSSLARTLRAQGELQYARELQQAAFEVRCRLLGAEHRQTLISMNNLANTLFAQGDLRGARELLARALEVQRRVAGDAHVDTIAMINNLAEMLRAQGGDSLGADELREKAVESQRRASCQNNGEKQA